MDLATVLARLRHVPLLASMDDAHLTALAERVVPRTFPADHLIFAQGDAGEALYFITSGLVRIARESASGREITLAMRNAGTFIGDMALLDGNPRSASAYAQTPCECLVLLREDFDAFLDQYPRAARVMLGYLSMRLRFAAQQVEDLASRTVRQRLAALLVQTALRNGEPDGDGILLPPTLNYRMLTGLLLTIRESVSRAVSDLCDEGQLERVGRRLRVVSLEGLRAIAEEVV